jgi:hypothetical protein
VTFVLFVVLKKQIHVTGSVIGHNLVNVYCHFFKIILPCPIRISSHKFRPRVIRFTNICGKKNSAMDARAVMASGTTRHRLAS